MAMFNYGINRSIYDLPNFLIRPEEIIIDGKIGSGVIQLFSSILFLSIPVTDFIRNRIDKKIEKKNVNIVN